MPLIRLFTCSALIICSIFTQAATLEVGPGKSYTSFEAAAAVCTPGDTILFYEATYNSKQNVTDLQGTESKPITITAVQGHEVIFSNANEAWHLTDVAWLNISNIIFEKLRTNGVNIDDGGDYSTPSHHINLRDCIFRDMDASGNNDLLKLSGVDYMVIWDCEFLNGSAGGSGIDMVGCHNVSIYNNSFENMGSNAIQAKGGTQYLEILANKFTNCGHRSVNLGGSTGLQFFRPIDAPFEAADISVYSNLFIGSIASVAYVGSVRVDVANNTMINPEKWAFRILQETVDTTRFAPCGYGRFANNLIFCDSRVTTASNIGPNTAPQTFLFTNNLWYNHENSSWSGPSLPVTDPNQILGEDPLFEDATGGDYDLRSTSPAVAKGIDITNAPLDFLGRVFNDPRSIGAFEGDPAPRSIRDLTNSESMHIWPNPSNGKFFIRSTEEIPEFISIVDLTGQVIVKVKVDMISQETGVVDLHILPAGIYILEMPFARKKVVISSR